MIDLRSDTVTQPTMEMRDAMANAELGDDVYGEDPTINLLEEKTAHILGKEAAIFTPSGTMANQLALLAHTKRGDEVLLDPESHIMYYEVGAPAMLAGIQLRPVQGLLGRGAADKLVESYRDPDIHFPNTTLVCLENTFNRGGGTIMGSDEMQKVYKRAGELRLLVHLDGARIFNASTASGCDVKEFTQYCDTLMFSFSKGLCAPVGSILAGSKDFIDVARKYRKALGGGMRQGGVLAAACIVALDKMIERLHEDHRNAKILAEGLAEIKGLKVDLDKVQTNIVIVDTYGTNFESREVLDRLFDRNVKANAFGPYSVRFVTHKDISRKDIEKALGVVKDILD